VRAHAVIQNVFGFQRSLKAAWAITDIPMIILPTLAFLLRDRKCYAAVTALYIPLCALEIWVPWHLNCGNAGDNEGILQ
jgi:hypothetical protein